MQRLILVRVDTGARLNAVLDEALLHLPTKELTPQEVLEGGGRGTRLLFCFSLGRNGSAAAELFLIALRGTPTALNACVVGMVTDANSEFLTKDFASRFALAANGAGALLVGKPLVEGTGSLYNFHIRSMNAGVTLLDAYKLAVRDLAQRLMDYAPVRRETARVLMLHASEHATSNTYALGCAVAERLGQEIEVTTRSLQNGALIDCRGCSYKTCLHYAHNDGCFYGGSLTTDVFPTLLESDALLLLCPNYNDSVSANIMAFINRLTNVLVKTPLNDKYVYAIIVSGYSGGDLVARQVLGALSMNKTFMLHPHFCLAETANEPNAALHLPAIEERLTAFAGRMRRCLLDGEF